MLGGVSGPSWFQNYEVVADMPLVPNYPIRAKWIWICLDASSKSNGSGNDDSGRQQLSSMVVIKAAKMTAAETTAVVNNLLSSTTVIKMGKMINAIWTSQMMTMWSLWTSMVINWWKGIAEKMENDAKFCVALQLF